jgi:signal peptidase I
MIDPVHSNALSLLRASLEAGTVARLRIDGVSMRPILRQGDIVVVRSCPIEELRLGDVLVIQRENDLVTHRLVAVKPDGWYTKGDASSALDSPAAEEAILGRVEAVERGSLSWSTQSNRWIGASRFIGWLAWQEIRVYRFYRRFTIEDGEGLKWWAYLWLFPFRLPIWLLAALRR